MLEIENLTKIYKADGVETIALNAVNLKLEEGDYIAIMGPSGCGKSTLLNIMGFLDTPSSGLIKFRGKELSTYTEKQRAKIRKNNIGFIFQNFNLIDELDVFENVELPLIYLKVSQKERKERVNAILEKLRIVHRKNHFPQQLSGGQQQKVAIARAIIARPKMILADEPTGNLDSKNGQEIMQLLSSLNEEKTTVVMATHSSSDASYARKIIHLFDGRVVSEKQITPQMKSIFSHKL